MIAAKRNHPLWKVELITKCFCRVSDNAGWRMRFVNKKDVMQIHASIMTGNYPVLFLDIE
jgi:hypothetical protein